MSVEVHDQGVPQTVSAYDNVPGNFYDKYGTDNPIARLLMKGFLAHFDSLVSATGVRTAYEVGCGEGHLALRMMKQGHFVRGSDLEPSVVAEASALAYRHGFESDFSVGDIYALTNDHAGAELLVCCEVLEHLPDPQRALDILAQLANPYLLVSVPREPIWRMLNMVRGRYIRSLGNTPGHLQHWSKNAFLAFLASRFEILDVRSPLPWTMVLCSVRQ